MPRAPKPPKETRSYPLWDIHACGDRPNERDDNGQIKSHCAFDSGDYPLIEVEMQYPSTDAPACTISILLSYGEARLILDEFKEAIKRARELAIENMVQS